MFLLMLSCQVGAASVNGYGFRVGFRELDVFFEIVEGRLKFIDLARLTQSIAARQAGTVFAVMRKRTGLTSSPPACNLGGRK